MFATAFCWSVYFVTFFWGLDNTSIAHAYVLTNVHAVVIVGFNLVTGREKAGHDLRVQRQKKQDVLDLSEKSVCVFYKKMHAFYYISLLLASSCLKILVGGGL